jgi:hypothetical protein
VNLALHRFVDELHEAVGPDLADKVDDALRDLVDDDSEAGIRWSDWLTLVARRGRTLDQKLHAIRLLIRIESYTRREVGLFQTASFMPVLPGGRQ